MTLQIRANGTLQPLRIQYSAAQNFPWSLHLTLSLTSSDLPAAPFTMKYLNPVQFITKYFNNHLQLQPLGFSQSHHCPFTIANSPPVHDAITVPFQTEKLSPCPEIHCTALFLYLTLLLHCYISFVVSSLIQSNPSRATDRPFRTVVRDRWSVSTGNINTICKALATEANEVFHI